MRLGEILSLDWADLNFEQTMVTVKGEGSKSSQTRRIPMNEELFETLTNWKEQSNTTVGFVFPGKFGRCMDNIKKSWDGLRQRTNLKQIKFKDLRSEFGSRLANNGVDLAITQRLLGHSSPVITMRYYVTLHEQTMRDAINLAS